MKGVCLWSERWPWVIWVPSWWGWIIWAFRPFASLTWCLRLCSSIFLYSARIVSGATSRWEFSYCGRPSRIWNWIWWLCEGRRTFLEIINFGLEGGEIREIGGWRFDEKRGMPVGLCVHRSRWACFFIEFGGYVDNHYVFVICILMNNKWWQNSWII